MNSFLIACNILQQFKYTKWFSILRRFAAEINWGCTTKVNKKQKVLTSIFICSQRRPISAMMVLSSAPQRPFELQIRWSLEIYRRYEQSNRKFERERNWKIIIRFSFLGFAKSLSHSPRRIYYMHCGGISLNSPTMRKTTINKWKKKEKRTTYEEGARLKLIKRCENEDTRVSRQPVGSIARYTSPRLRGVCDTRKDKYPRLAIYSNSRCRIRERASERQRGRDTKGRREIEEMKKLLPAYRVDEATVNGPPWLAGLCSSLTLSLSIARWEQSKQPPESPGGEYQPGFKSFPTMEIVRRKVRSLSFHLWYLYILLNIRSLG